MATQLTNRGEPHHRLYIGGEDYTGRAANIQVSYTDSSGASQLTFSCSEPLDDKEFAPVVLQLWYGDEEPVDWFVGSLQRTIPQSNGFCDATALGPFGQMATQYFMQQVTYDNYRLATALYDIALKASYPAGVVIVRGGQNVLVQDATFTEDTSLQEGANTLMESASFVCTDLPGGNRIFRPLPTPGTSGQSRVSLGPGDYPADGGLTIEDRYDGSYSWVICYRSSTDSGYEVYAKVPVHNTRPMSRRAPRNRAYYITDFVGDQQQATNQAYEMARRLAVGEYHIQVSGFPICPELARYDQLEITRLVEKKDGTYQETYSIIAEDEVSCSVTDWTMSVDGYGVLVESTRVASPVVRVSRGISNGVVAVPQGGAFPSDYGVYPSSTRYPNDFSYKGG